VSEISRIYSRISVYTPEGATLNKHLFVDSTGVGKPITDLLERDLPECRGKLHAVYITGGEPRATINALDKEINLPKSYLISRLQILISCGRVHLPRNNRESYAMASELKNFQIKVSDSANAQFGAKTGAHDDLVTALGLACLCERNTSIPFVLSRGTRSGASSILKGYD
jgi:hypothetical protein